MTPQEAIEHGKEQLEVFEGEHKEFIKESIKALEKLIPRADAEELDCENCIWNNYPVYFKNKRVPCEFLKCDCFSKVMYEYWSDSDEDD